MVQDQDVQNTKSKQSEKSEATSAPEAEQTAQTEAHAEVAAEASTDTSAEANSDESADTGSSEKESVRIEFPYSELLREKAPKAFELAEKVATDWKNEGDFTDLGITHPVAGIVAAQALTKAKEVEKKLEEKGVISMAKLGFAIAKSQVETIKSKIVKSE